MTDTIEARADVNDFPTLGEAIDEAILRADGEKVWLHKKSCQWDVFDADGTCPCEPLQVDSVLTK